MLLLILCEWEISKNTSLKRTPTISWILPSGTPPSSHDEESTRSTLVLARSWGRVLFVKYTQRIFLNKCLFSRGKDIIRILCHMLQVAFLPTAVLTSLFLSSWLVSGVERTKKYLWRSLPRDIGSVKEMRFSHKIIKHFSLPQIPYHHTTPAPVQKRGFHLEDLQWQNSLWSST